MWFKIVIYNYDSPNNPWCGGGGAKREHEIHKRIIRSRYVDTGISPCVLCFNGYYPDCEDSINDGIIYMFLPPCWFGGYLMSRLIYTIIANIDVWFNCCDIINIGFSHYSPVICFKKNVIVTFPHFIPWKIMWRKYKLFAILPFISEWIVVHFNKRFIVYGHSTAKELLRRNPRAKIDIIPPGV